jgi:hypothetical protein
MQENVYSVAVCGQRRSPEEELDEDDDDGEMERGRRRARKRRRVVWPGRYCSPRHPTHTQVKRHPII